MSERLYPRWIYLRSGEARIAQSPADEAGLDCRDNPGMFLPPDHPAHVPDPSGAAPVSEAPPPARAPEPPVDLLTVPEAAEARAALAAVDPDAAFAELGPAIPAAEVLPARRRRGRPRKEF